MNPVLLIAIPLLFAFISIASKKLAMPFLLLVTAFNVGAVFFMDKGMYSIGGFNELGINLLLDQLAFVGLVLVNSLFFLVILTNCKDSRKLSTVLLITLAGVNGLLLTNDLFNLFVFLEITGISAYLITTQNKKPLASFNYLVQGTVGSGLYLLGLILLYTMIGTLNMAEVFSRINEYSIPASNLVLPFMLMFIGLGVEAKLLPFNSWVKGVLDNANALTSAMIATVIASAIALTFGRLLNIVFVLDNIMVIITVILAVTIIAGEAAAFVSKNVREILLFSAIATSGLTIILFANGLVVPAIMLVIANALSKFILFTITGKIIEQTNTDYVDELQGVFANNKLMGTVYSVAALSVTGLPLFFGFVVKLNLLQGLFSLDMFLIPALILVASLIEGTYFIRLLVKLWYGEHSKVKFNLVVKAVTVVFAAIIVILGVYSEPVTDLVEDIPAEIVEYLEGGNF
ncbi:proton-conducting transporter membrane subunit [Mycoplasmatota bacterium WC44]